MFEYVGIDVEVVVGYFDKGKLIGCGVFVEYYFG